MNGTRRLRLPLLVGGIYGVVAGIALLFPMLGEVVFARPVADAAVQSGWGTSVISIGLFSLAMAMDTKRYGTLAWVLVAGLLLTAADLIYFWMIGEYTARTALMPTAINVLLAAWLFAALPKRAVTGQEAVATPGSS